MRKIHLKAKVIANQKLSSSHYRLVLDEPSIARKAKPGQFVHIQINEGIDPYFRRPFSVARVQKHVEILYAVVGRGTGLMSRKRKGDVIDLLGPLGNHFRMPPAGTENVFLIAGAIGIAPFIMLSDALKGKGYAVEVLYGARDKSQIFDMKAFRQNGCAVHYATEDGSRGAKGRIPALYSRVGTDSGKTYLYACGPKPMLSSVLAFARKHHFRGQISAEEVMACGIGVCLGCAIQTKAGYKTVCNDGPVFDFNEFNH
jgi:dihydroorotate dehydrogenase electron transfer subunit